MKIYSKNDAYTYRVEEDGNYLFYNKLTGETCILNNSAYLMWLGCDGKRTRSELIEELVKEYNIQQDMLKYIDDAFDKLENKLLLVNS